MTRPVSGIPPIMPVKAESGTADARLRAEARPPRDEQKRGRKPSPFISTRNERGEACAR
jgi:hypothetical protein